MVTWNRVIIMTLTTDNGNSTTVVKQTPLVGIAGGLTAEQSSIAQLVLGDMQSARCNMEVLCL